MDLQTWFLITLGRLGILLGLIYPLNYWESSRRRYRRIPLSVILSLSQFLSVLCDLLYSLDCFAGGILHWPISIFDSEPTINKAIINWETCSVSFLSQYLMKPICERTKSYEYMTKSRCSFSANTQRWIRNYWNSGLLFCRLQQVFWLHHWDFYLCLLHGCLYPTPLELHGLILLFKLLAHTWGRY